MQPPTYSPAARATPSPGSHTCADGKRTPQSIQLRAYRACPNLGSLGKPSILVLKGNAALLHLFLWGFSRILKTKWVSLRNSGKSTLSTMQNSAIQFDHRSSWGGVLEDQNCSTCKALYKTRCSYDPDSRQSRKSTTRRRITAFTREESAITIIRAIKSYPVAEVAKIVDKIRTNDNLDMIAEYLRNKATLPNVSNIALTGERFDQLIRSATDLQYPQSVIPGGPSIPWLASPLSYDPSQNLTWSLCTGSV